MKTKTISILKIIFTALFGAAVTGAFVWVNIKGEIADKPWLTYGCIALSFLLALIFVGRSLKRLFLVLGLACHVAAAYFLIFDPLMANSQLIGICILCGAQLCFLLYTLLLSEGIGARVVNIATRVALCLVACLILPKYIVGLTTIDIIFLAYLINAVVSLIWIGIHIVTEWLTFIAMVILVFALVWGGLGLYGGWFVHLGINNFMVLLNYNIAFYLYIPALLILAISSVWAKPKKKA
ncbi:MAG: hypothetical protein IJX00_03200 [Clostridia bacterium]|nr:hypothetical protein [Clostridia bacterium]